MSERIQSKPRHAHPYEHFGCPDCGDIFHLPAMKGEDGPWCLHNNNYSWRAPHPDTQTEYGGRNAWTQMVRVDVFSRD